MANKDFMKTATDAVASSVSATAADIRNKFNSSGSNTNTGFAGLPTSYNSGISRELDDIPNDAFSNTATTQQDAGTGSNAGEFAYNFQPNLLDKFDTYTFHWKLFITPLLNAYNGTVLESKVQTIIAETGVTDLTLEKVEISAVCVPSIEGGTGTQTQLKFQITEPSGAAFLDKLYYESVALGLGNWIVMPCFLQLEFRGRDTPNSESPESGSPAELNSLKWVWPIKLTDTKAHVSHVGTRYDMTAIFFDELAQSNSYFGIQHNIVLDKLDTFESAIRDLEKKLKKDQEDKLMDSYGFPDVYKFVIDPIIKQKANLLLVDKNRHTSRWGDFIDFEKKQASYNSGTGIDKIIDSLLGNTKYYQEELQSAPAPNAEPKAANDAAPMRKFWRIVTETHPYVFDPIRQDNAVEITVYIVEYNIGLIEAVPTQTGQTPDTLQAAKNRMAEYNKKRILNKRYDYIFTGLNDQIITFDLNMNMAFAAALSRFGAIYYGASTKDMGVTAQTFSEDERKLATEVNQKLKMYNRAEGAADKTALAAEIQQSIETAKVSPEEKARNMTLLEKVKGGKFNSDKIKNDAIEAQKLLSVNSIAQTNRSNPDLKFISDVDVRSPASQAAIKNAESLSAGKLRPIPYREAPQEANLAMGTEPSSDAGRARTSSIFANALYSTVPDGNFQTIKMTIKGDPYWLFPRWLDANAKSLQFKSAMSEGEAVELIKEVHLSKKDSVNLFGTDNFIIIRFRTPQVANEESGLVDRPDSPNVEIETFSGVYKVITITSKFERGVFTQELFCLLDPVINLKDFLKNIEASAKRTSSQQEEYRKSEIQQAPPVNTTKLTGEGLKQAVSKQVTQISKSNVPAVDYRIAEAGAKLKEISKEVESKYTLGKSTLQDKLSGLFGSGG